MGGGEATRGGAWRWGSLCNGGRPPGPREGDILLTGHADGRIRSAATLFLIALVVKSFGMTELFESAQIALLLDLISTEFSGQNCCRQQRDAHACMHAVCGPASERHPAETSNALCLKHPCLDKQCTDASFLWSLSLQKCCILLASLPTCKHVQPD